MDNKYLLPFIIAGLTLAFGIITFLVLLTKKNPYLVQMGLKIDRADPIIEFAV
ncbi:MAG: hypothetical protein QME58_07730 [Bacteroidota bacterium]|nr:hypothetical protein [Bacteroidota bacterium]